MPHPVLRRYSQPKKTVALKTALEPREKLDIINLFPFHPPYNPRRNILTETLHQRLFITSTLSDSTLLFNKIKSVCEERRWADKACISPEPNNVKRFQTIITMTDEDYRVVQYNLTDVSKETDVFILRV